MKRNISCLKLINHLREKNIQTWFDLGLFIDSLREERKIGAGGDGFDYTRYTDQLRSGGVAFITFHYMVDGVTVEVGKYAQLFEKNFPGIPIHYIAGNFKNKSDSIISDAYIRKEIPEITGFDDWKLYDYFFKKSLERGSEAYNYLIKAFWSEVMEIIELIGQYIEDNDISLIYLINVCSNPGNVSAALALVLLSEFMGLPVINNNHDFYFEGGNNKFERESKGLKKGPRDFFFTNAHLGEVFSIIEMLYPWESRLWLNVNINRTQSEYLIRKKGHNPARVMEIGTAVDTGIYKKNDKRRNINTFIQFEKVLARYRKQLVGYSVEDVLSGNLVLEENPKPILIGNKTRAVNNFISENIIFLQPTRIISRKRIELGFNLLLKMLENPDLKLRLANTKNLKITFLISGPIAVGHYEYYKKILKRFQELLNEVPEKNRNRVFLALLLGELDRDSFRKKIKEPIGIPELYNIASLILLPSKTEGRGLPIIEATACGTPIFCRRYDPEEVYSEVIGEHLNENDRLRVYEFRGKKIGKTIVSKIIQRVFFPHDYTADTKHNKTVVEKRYSLNALNENMERILFRLYHQLKDDTKDRALVQQIFSEYEDVFDNNNEDLKYLLKTSNREYLPGYGRLSFMLMLKSLIDPSYFRVEEQVIRGMVYYFAREIITHREKHHKIEEEEVIAFYNAVYHIFTYKKGEDKIRHDHSMSYRHRNKYYYPYQDYTFQEITGLVNLLYLEIIRPIPKTKVDLSPQFFTDWNLALSQLTTSNYLAIDNRVELIQMLKANLPIAYFPGEYIMYELEFFALQALRSRMNLPIETEVTEALLETKSKEIAPVYIFAQEKRLGKQLNKEEISSYIEAGVSHELKLLFQYNLISIISTNQLCVGIHFAQLGKEALKVLREIRQAGGFLLTNRRHAALMTDIVNIDRFHIGRVRADFASNIMGIPIGSGYIQFVPAGLRTTLAYPTPVQTALDFNSVLQSEEFRMLTKKIGTEDLYKELVTDAERRGSPIKHVVSELLKPDHKNKAIKYEYLSGVYDDGNPYSGVVATANLLEFNWDFRVISTKDRPKTVSVFVSDFEKETGNKSEIAWNGGYILNPELVGKLGLSEAYIGSPLGLLITGGECLCPPLFNKAALLISKEGKAEIRRVNCRSGINVTGNGWSFSFNQSNYNCDTAGNEIAFYDLMFDKGELPGDGNVIVRLSGNIIKEIFRTKEGENVFQVPTGLTLSIPTPLFPENMKINDKVEIRIPGLENIEHAVEAGPMLVSNGNPEIDMEIEGWKKQKSIATQAARLDYLDMRGPKIAVGMDEKGSLAVLTVNGRIRESVGATHLDMANIMIGKGMTAAMGFDPGGSSTLVVQGRTLNISPYNHRYEYNPYSLPPEPRAVSNAVIGYIRKDG